MKRATPNRIGPATNSCDCHRSNFKNSVQTCMTSCCEDKAPPASRPTGPVKCHPTSCRRTTFIQSAIKHARSLPPFHPQDSATLPPMSSMSSNEGFQGSQVQTLAEMEAQLPVYEVLRAEVELRMGSGRPPGAKEPRDPGQELDRDMAPQGTPH